MTFRYLLSASFFGLAAAVISRGGVFVANLILAKDLPLEVFGLVSFAYMTALNLGNFVTAGLSQTSARILAKHRDEMSVVTSKLFALLLTSIALALLVSALIFFNANHIVEMLGNGKSDAGLFQLASLILVFVILGAVSQSMLFAIGKHVTSSSIAVVSALVMVMAVAGVSEYQDPRVSLFALGVAGILQTMFCAWTLMGVMKSGLRGGAHLTIKKETLLEVRQFLWPALLVAFVGAPVHWLCMSLLASVDNGVAQVGIFNVAFQWYLLISFVPAAIGNMSLTFMARNGGELGGAGSISAERILFISLCVVFLVSFVLGAPLIFATDYVLMLYDEEYHQAQPVISVLAAAGSVTGLTICLQNYIAVRKGMWVNFVLSILYALSYLTGTFLIVSNEDGIAINVAKIFLLSWSILLVAQFFYILVFIFKRADFFRLEARS